MDFLKYFFQKRDAALRPMRIEQEQRMRMNPLRGFDPDKLVRAIDGFRCGDIGDLSRIIDELETRDDMMTGCARKTRASVGRCPHQILIAEGFENDKRAKEHQEILKKFWSRIEVSSAFARNERGGIRLLKKQMMGSVSRVYSVHEIVWKPRADGSISAKFIQVPNWFFENRTGELRFLRDMGAIDGMPMPAGEWLVTVGDGIGIAASVLAMSKVLSRNDWLLFSERCGQPGLHVTTSAAEGSTVWNKLVNSVKSFGREWALVSDQDTKINPVNLNVGGTLPYPPLIEMCDKGIASLYRGADLSTISGTGDSNGASVQGDETDILEQDACEMVSETLAAQVERYVIRYTSGDAEPLAYIRIAPSDRPNVDQDVKIDTHLVGLGVKLSKNDALARYGRSEYDATDESDAPLMQAQQGAAMPTVIPGTPAAAPAADVQQAALNGAQIDSIVKVVTSAASGEIPQAAVLPTLQLAFPSFDPSALAKIVESLEGFTFTKGGEAENAGEPVAKPLQKRLDGTGAPRQGLGNETPQSANLEGLAKSLARDMQPVAEKIKALLALPESEQAAAALKLMEELPGLLPTDPEMAAVLENSIAEAFAERAGEPAK